MRVTPTVPVEFDTTRPMSSQQQPATVRASSAVPNACQRRRSSAAEAIVLWRKAVFRVNVIKEAAGAMLMVLRNAVASCICAWIANFFFSLGEPFALTPSRKQSTASLILANLLWTNVIFCSIMVVTHTAVLLPLRFISNPDKPSTPWFCIKQLVRTTYGFFLSSFALNVCLGLFVGSALPSSMHQFKIDFYVGNLANHHYTTGIDIATRTIFKTQTIDGQEWIRRREQQPKQQPQRPPLRKPKRTSVYRTTFVKGASKLVPMFLSGAYVHIVSQTHLFSHGLKTFTFVAITTVTKVLLQGAIKMYVVKYRIKSVRTMCALVGLPTVLIDTQVRIMLLCQQSYIFAVTGMVAMSVVEIIIRGSKAALLCMELQHRQSTIHNGSASITQPQLPQTSGNPAAKTSTVDDRAASIPLQSSISTEQRDFEQLRDLIYRFHAAEASADMHAGYIAIGCSASIWFFFSNHPHYDLGLRSTDSDSLSTMAPLLFIQVGVEIVTDYMSCVLEAAAGVDFKSMNKFGLFLALIFIIHAILNIAISAVLYLK